MKEYCLVWDAAVSELENLYELETECALSKSLSMVLSATLHNIQSAWGQADSAPDAFSNNSRKDSVSSMRK